MLPSRLLLVRQNLPDLRLADVRAEARRQLEQSGFAARLQPGARVAIGVGSRGIANIAAIVQSVVQYWRDHGMAPFIFPAMGSHGAATAEGQADVLAHFGMTEQSMGCPIVSRLDVVSLGETDEGIEVFMDAAAHGADGVMIVGRVKWHTNFDGRLESGLMKMMAIGLGKFAGAQKYHTHAQRLGLEHVIRTAGRRVLQSGKMIGGLAIIEDAHHNTAKLDAVPADCHGAARGRESRAREILDATAAVRSRRPHRRRDGEEHQRHGHGRQSRQSRARQRIQPLAGIAVDPADLRARPGSADPRQRARDRHGGRRRPTGSCATIDWEPTRVNALSSRTPSRIRVPAHFASDRECLQWVAATAGKLDPADVTYGWIRNTLELDRLAISHNLRARIVEIAADRDRAGDRGAVGRMGKSRQSLGVNGRLVALRRLHLPTDPTFALTVVTPLGRPILSRVFDFYSVGTLGGA